MTAKDLRKAEAIKRLKDLFAQGGKRLSFVRVGPSSFRVWLLTDEIRAIYATWFQRPLPSGVTLNLPMSPHLEHVFQLEGQYSD